MFSNLMISTTCNYIIYHLTIITAVIPFPITVIIANADDDVNSNSVMMIKTK